jgi:NADH-quinone oxidoreductase subunit J
VIVYAGAVVVLFLFVIMLLNLQAELRAMSGLGLVASALAGGTALVVLLAGAVWRPTPAADLPAGFGETAAIAERLFTTFLLPFELTSVLLLVAVIGAIAMAQRRNG